MKKLKNKTKLFLSMCSLGASFLSKCFIGIIFLYYYFADIFDLPFFQCVLHIKINGFVCRIIVRRISDFWVMKDDLLDREYDIETKDPKIIIDLGANIGISTLFFATKYPGGVIHAVEPNPDIYPDLSFNTSGFKNIKIYQVAIAEKNGKIDLYTSKSGASSSTLLRDSSDKHYIVDAITLDNFLKENGIKRVDVLKFDIEGAETVIFRSFDGFNKVRSYAGEIHYDLNDLTRKEIMEKARNYSFKEKYLKKGRSILYLNS